MNVIPFKLPLHVYLIEDGASHWYVATSEEAALAEYVETVYGGSVEDHKEEYPETTITQCDDDHKITITFDPDRGDDFDGDEEVTKTCAEWVDERGEGCLCSSEW